MLSIHLLVFIVLGTSANAAVPPVTPRSRLQTTFSGLSDVEPFSLQLSPDTAKVCNSTTPGTSGFITSDDGQGGNNSIFFWAFESKHEPKTDPVILWMSGGPGASSVGYGNLMELGPCRIASEGGYTVDNEFGWNANATVLFVDQPVGVGYSRGQRIPAGIRDSSMAMVRFLRQFMTAFPELADRDFYIAGESYGGSWVPALASTILKSESGSGGQRGRLMVQEERSNLPPNPRRGPKINLKGIMIGNGLVRRSVQNMGFFETVCSGPDSLFNSSQCLEWAPRAMWCEDNLAVCEVDGMQSPACKEVEIKCSGISKVIVEDMHRNPYDFHRECRDPDSCYSEMRHIDEYLNRSDVKTALGVPENEPFIGISLDVFKQWEKVGDLWRASDEYVNHLLQSHIRVLIYVGDQDLYCNAAGTRLLVDRGLSWHGQPIIRLRELVPWYLGTKSAGLWKSYEPLTYAEVAGAGHLVPFDKPEEALTLINSWIHGRLPAL